MAETIENVHKYLMLASPLWYLLALAVSAAALRDTENKYTTLKWAVTISLVLGLVGISEIKPGGWNLQYLMTPFVVLKWAAIAYSICWPVLVAEAGIKSKPVVAAAVLYAALGLGGLGVTVADHMYVTKVYAEDIKFWNDVLRKNDSSLPLSTYGSHLSREGRIGADNLVYNDAHNRKEPQLSIDMLRMLYGLGFDVSRHPKIDAELVANIRASAKINEAKFHPDSPAGHRISASLAANPGITADVLEELSDHPGREVVRNITLNRNAPPALLEKIISKREGSREIVQLAKRNLAGNPLTPERRIRELSRDLDTEIRRKAAQNPSAPVDLLQLLSSDPDEWTKIHALETLGKSSRTPRKMLVELSIHRDERIRAAVAANESAPRDLIITLLNDEKYDVCYNAVRNLIKQQNPPVDVMKERIRKMSPNTRSVIMNDLKNVNQLPDWLYAELIK